MTLQEFFSVGLVSFGLALLLGFFAATQRENAQIPLWISFSPVITIVSCLVVMGW
jgi:hypothetical protein